MPGRRGEPLRHPRNRFGVRGRADVEHRCAAGSDERQAPLRSHDRRRERLRHGHAVRVRLLLLGSSLHDPRVRRREAAQKVALAAVRLEQRHLPLGQRDRERDPGGAAAGADIHHRPVVFGHDLDRAQRVLEEHAPRLLEIAKRRQARRGDDSRQPVLKRQPA